MNGIKVIMVETGKQRDAFARFGNELYKDNPYYVPDLEIDIKDTLNPKKNASFEFSEAQMFLALDCSDKIVGRVVAIINHRANERWNVKNVRFGYLDFVDDEDVSKALLDAVVEWGKEKGMTHVQGPLGFTDFDKEGMLVDDYDRMGSMTAIYNYPYYPVHMEHYGMKKEADWVQIRVAVPHEVPVKFARVSDMVKKRFGMRVVKINHKMVYKEHYGKRIFDLLNKAYAPLFGFSKLSDKQIDQYLKTYLSLLDLQLTSCVVTDDDQLVGVGITMGSLSKALRKTNGKLLPLGWYHMLKSLRWKPEETVEMLLIAVDPAWQGKGVNALIFEDLIPIYNKYGFKWAETGPQLETNTKELSQWDIFEPEYIKRRRCYVKDI